ncbi:hypothetical protein [Bradyrhizobium ottawaense]|uniref:Uncharacterized protein n=1 Tax=Bradyrhizobium ottawaense TaxID=931866 RepID=A0ABV4G4R0_9BRAD
MRLIRLLVGRLCFKLSLRLTMAGATICALDCVAAPSFPLYHY